MHSRTDDQNSFLARLPLSSKIAAGLFVIAKIHGVIGVLTMFVHRPLAGFLLTVACVSLCVSAGLAMLQMLRLDRPRTLEQRLAWHRAEIERLEGELEG